MQQETINYSGGGINSLGRVFYDPKFQGKRPAVIVAHAWRGQDEFALEKARYLAELGYVGFAADVYGGGVSVSTDEEARVLMAPLYADRICLRERITAAFNAVKSLEMVDSNKIGAIGFCFGGLTVIELLRSGADVKGVVSFHGALGKSVAGLAPSIKGSILMLHGYNDPLMSEDDVLGIQAEFNDAKVDWQMHIYGHAVHAFTNPAVHDLGKGLCFDAKANARAFASMELFFKEVFSNGRKS